MKNYIFLTLTQAEFEDTKQKQLESYKNSLLGAKSLVNNLAQGSRCQKFVCLSVTNLDFLRSKFSPSKTPANGLYSSWRSNLGRKSLEICITLTKTAGLRETPLQAEADYAEHIFQCFILAASVTTLNDEQLVDEQRLFPPMPDAPGGVSNGVKD